MNINEILRSKGKKIISASKDFSVMKAAVKMVREKVGSIVILNDKKFPIGIFTERDLLRLVAKDDLNLENTALNDVMTTKLIICYIDDEVEKVRATMTEKRVRHMPVFDEKKMVGIVSLGDLVKASLNQKETEVKYLSDYITGSY